MKVEARYLCMDTRGKPNFSVWVTKGFLWWRKTKNYIAYWDNVMKWVWQNGIPVADTDIRVALSEAYIKVGFYE